MAKKISDFTARLDTEVDGTEFIVLSDTDAVYNTVTASTISASTTDDSFNDSANGLGGYKVGTTINVTGFVTGSLNTSYTVATVASDGSKITVSETLTADDAAGSSVTIDGLGVNYKMTLTELSQFLGSGASLEPVLVSDLNAPTYSGFFYTNATTSNRLNIMGEGFVDLIVDHLEIDASSAMQRGIDYVNNRYFFRSKNSGVWNSFMEISAAEVSTAGWPAISDENALLNDEGDSFTGWTSVLGSPSSIGSEIVLPSSPTAGSRADRTIDLPNTNDYIVYIKIRSEVNTSFAYLQFNNGATGVIHFALGYDWTIGSASSNTISASLLTTSENVKLATGVDYSVAQEYAIHIDRDRGHISFYNKVSGSWDFQGSLTYNASLEGVDTLIFAQGSPSPKPESGLDYFTVCRPNVIAIGDSICAGHTLFDPDPTFYAGVDDYDSTWMKHANIYSSLRNNFIVNKGVGSNTTTQMLARVTETTAHSPRVVFVQASSNDYGAAISQATRTSEMQSIIDAINATGADVVILNGIYANSSNAQYPAQGAYMLDWWDNYRQTLTGYVLDIDTMQPVISGGYIDAAYAQADGIHPNVAGYTLIGDYIEAQEP